jgi:hypothetical protein
MEAISSFETSVDFQQTAQFYIPEDRILQTNKSTDCTVLYPRRQDSSNKQINRLHSFISQKTGFFNQTNQQTAQFYIPEDRILQTNKQINRLHSFISQKTGFFKQTNLSLRS